MLQVTGFEQGAQKVKWQYELSDNCVDIKYGGTEACDNWRFNIEFIKRDYPSGVSLHYGRLVWEKDWSTFVDVSEVISRFKSACAAAAFLYYIVPVIG